ncbi:hypothetical protein SPONN_819 [uncultured Candidatus Thioglobus sp.]|nr:hypothetical protein SPONN_819 [uncultured Candidatus Thioglobus sp.]
MLADKDFAPKVLHFNEAAMEHFKMVVMEEVQGAVLGLFYTEIWI